MKKKVMALILAGCFLLTAASPEQSQKVYELIYEDVQALKKQMLALQEKLQNLTAELQSVKSQVQDLQTLLKSWQQDQAATRQGLKDIPVQYQILSDRLDQISSRLDRIAEDLLALRTSSSPPSAIQEQKPGIQPPGESQKQTKPAEPPKKESAPQSQAAPPTGPSPQELYNTAYNDYLRGNYDLAIESFRLYREQFAESPLADNALYWIGECYFSQKKFDEAIAAFNDIILLYPKGDRVAASYLKKGLCYVEMGKKEEALAVFKLLISKFPLEEEAKIAQQKIRELTT